MNDNNLLREAALNGIRKVGGKDLLDRMIDLFLENAPRRLDALRSARDAGDLDAMSRAAHSLKSSAGNFGAVGLQDLSGQIEQLAGEGKGDTLPALVGQLESMFERVHARLTEVRSEADSA